MRSELTNNDLTGTGPRSHPTSKCGHITRTKSGLHTVQRYDRAATWQELADGRWQASRASKLDPFKPYLDQHAGEGHGSFTRLFNEIRELGYDGSYSVVRNYLNQVRPHKAPLGQAPPTVRDVKMIKRQMFGRAGLPLLRKRVLLTAQS